MSEQAQLPVCDVCKEYPIGGGTAVSCMTPGCGMRGAVLCESEWRRLMTSPRLAPELVEALRYAARLLEIEWYTGMSKTVRAALAALGEDAP